MNTRILLVGLAVACSAPAAFAHAFLQHADPGAGATLNAPPRRVALIFTEKLEPVFSGVAVIDASGHSVEAGTVVIGGNSIIAPLLPLGPGKYRVVWHAVSVDTHRTEGGYSFTVRR
ncbi:MAG TPA: copper resistance protein CopC [Sphingomicrobium sp.]|nr:copper resistance protein CopC [Sphingomicrobium sp.]